MTKHRKIGKYIGIFSKPISRKQKLSSFDYVLVESKGYVYCFQEGPKVNIFDQRGEYQKSYKIMPEYTIENSKADIIDDYVCAVMYPRGNGMIMRYFNINTVSFTTV